MFVPGTFMLLGGRRSVVQCTEDACAQRHYLELVTSPTGCDAFYHPYTRTGTLGFYDDDGPPEVAILHTRSSDWASEFDYESFSGPIWILPRKKSFSRTEVKAIWELTRGRCHICRRMWRQDERGRTGWHIDHIVPHIGGGPDVEKLPNFRVACATCNLRKGRGYTRATVALALRQLLIATPGR